MEAASKNNNNRSQFIVFSYLSHGDFDKTTSTSSVGVKAYALGLRFAREVGAGAATRVVDLRWIVWCIFG